MGQAIGGSLTFAVGVAISPIPIIAVVLMLLSKRAAGNSVAFALGWIVGVGGALAVVVAVSGAIGTTDSGGAPTHGVSTVKLVLGVVLLALAVRRWRSRPAPGETAELPRWLQAVERITPPKSAGLAVVLSVANPKNLLMIMGGGLAIAGAPASTGDKVVASIVFGLIAVSTVVVPVVLTLLMGARIEPSLDSARRWLESNDSAVMAVVILVIGIVLLGKGIAGF